MTHGLLLKVIKELILSYRHEYLLENKPMVKFIRNYIRDTSGLFSTSSLNLVPRRSLESEERQPGNEVDLH